MKISFDEIVVIITGASSGIGRELALQLASQHARLSLVARNEAKLNEVAELCKQAGAECLCIPLDVSLQQNCEQIITRTVDRFGESIPYSIMLESACTRK